jgi:hypothetical protein
LRDCSEAGAAPQIHEPSYRILRPGEIFALTWGHLTATAVNVRQRIFRGIMGTPKSTLSVCQAALPEGLLRDIEAWRAISLVTGDDSWVFPSEKLVTPMSKDNCGKRNIKPQAGEGGVCLGQLPGDAADVFDAAGRSRRGRKAGGRTSEALRSMSARTSAARCRWLPACTRPASLEKNCW